MTSLLIKLFIKDGNNVKNPAVREKYGILSGAVGIALNMLLSVAKLFIGTVAHSISITADAINNLADAASSMITIAGFKIANKQADNDHPFGHGRFEYIAALIVGMLVELMGFELIKSSFGRIKNAESTTFSYAAVAVLVISILAKIWLAVFNKTLGKKINSPAMSAVVADSIADTTSTSVALLALIISKFTDISIDGYVGIAVALFILYSGFGIIKETVSELMGTPPDKELVNNIVSYVLSCEGVLGVHDLVIHSYGANSVFGSIHAEFSADSDLITTHDIIDRMEQTILEQFNVNIVVHLDPLVYDDEKINALRNMTKEILLSIDEELHFHDFRVVDGPTHTNLIFDVVVPHKFKLSDSEIKQRFTEELEKCEATYYAVITTERSYV